jgi:hypothetical protein
MPLPRAVDVLAPRERFADPTGRPAVDAPTTGLPAPADPILDPVAATAGERFAASAAGRRDTAPEAEPVTFRGATLEEAIALAEQSLGPRIRVVAANRIRRGGIGGFFASDLGVEVSVVLEDETIEDAIERMVAASDADERERWRSRASGPALEPASATMPNTSIDELLEILTAAPVAPVAPAASVGPNPTERLVADDLARVTDLRAFTAPTTVPVAPARERIEPTVVTAAAAGDSATVVATGVTPAPARALRPEVVRDRPTPPPTRRQVELAVAATDQLIERLAATPRVKKLSVKVVVRAGDRREVETEAVWEAM